MALGRHHTPMPAGGGIHPISSTPGRDIAELIQVRAQGVDQLGALIDQLLPASEHYGTGLLLLGFRLDKAHGRPLRRLHDSLPEPSASIGGSLSPCALRGSG